MQNLSRKQLNKRALWLGIICIILSVILVVLIAVGIPLIKGKGRFASSSTFHIKNSSEFIMALKHSSESKDKNLSYWVDEEIILSANDLPDEVNFYGTLNGQGHQITIKASESLASLDKPIFNTINFGAVIERLNIVLDDVQLSAEDKAHISLLAITNNGTIKNCSIKIANIEIGRCANTAALVNFNCGQIFNICLTVDNVKSIINNVNSWNSVFGTVATVNYANINNVLLDVTFDENLFVFQGQYINNKVGYVTGGITENGSIEDIYIFGKNDNDFRYLSKACDTYKSEDHSLIYNKKKYVDIDNKLQKTIQEKFNAVGGDTNNFANYWSWKDSTGKFPVLI